MARDAEAAQLAGVLDFNDFANIADQACEHSAPFFKPHVRSAQPPQAP